MKEDYFKNVKTTLKRVSDFLGDKPWFVGKEVMILLQVAVFCTTTSSVRHMIKLACFTLKS